MDNVETKIALWTLAISSTLNFLSLVHNIWWNFAQKKERKKLENYSNIKETILTYYIPMKYMLLQLQIVQLKILQKKPDFSVFQMYDNDVEKKLLRSALLKEYEHFLTKHKELDIKYANSSIDKKLDKIYTHIQLLLLIDEQDILDTCKEDDKYKMPCLSDLIDEIDKYAIQNRIF